MPGGTKGGSKGGSKGSNDSTKRKRQDSARELEPQPKRSAADVAALVAKDATLRNGFRTEITKIYSNYTSLLQGTATGSDELSAFQGLLDAAQGECSFWLFEPGSRN
jgi:hypothetical protein